MRAALLLVIIVAAAAAAGCGDDGKPLCSKFFGDATKPPELEMTVLPADGPPVAATEGMRVPMWKPPQGGRHVFVGARVRNVDLCALQVTGVVRDPESKRVKYEGRPVSYVDGGDGWAYPTERTTISSFANVNVCPNSWSSKDIFEQSYELEVSVLDREGRTGTVTMQATPYCTDYWSEAPFHSPALLAECQCICREDTSGTAGCGADAGP